METTDLTDVERRLVQSAVAGTVLDLAGDSPDRQVRAVVVRELLLGRVDEAATLDPKGVRARGLVVTGRVDLDYCTTTVPLGLEDSRLDGGLTAESAHLAHVSLAGCQITSTPVAASGSSVGPGPAAVDLGGAEIGGRLVLSGAILTNEDGPALDAVRLSTTAGVFLDGGFTAIGHGDRGAVSLVGAKIGGQLVLSAANLSNDTGPALDAFGASVTGSLLLDDGFTAIGNGDRGAVTLAGTQVAGRLSVSAPVLEGAGAGTGWRVDGMTFSGYPVGVTIGQWLGFLSSGTVRYAAQPYQHAAGLADAAGDDRDARRILMAQRSDQIRRGDLRATERVWARFTHLTLGYGYQPWRALVALAAILALAGVLVSTLGADPAVLGPRATTTTATTRGADGTSTVTTTEVVAGDCDRFGRAEIALDIAVPLISTPTPESCTVQPGTGGDWFTALAGILRVLAWGFAGLFAAGFTSIIRQT